MGLGQLELRQNVWKPSGQFNKDTLKYWARRKGINLCWERPSAVNTLADRADGRIKFVGVIRDDIVNRLKKRTLKPGRFGNQCNSNPYAGAGIIIPAAQIIVYQTGFFKKAIFYHQV